MCTKVLGIRVSSQGPGPCGDLVSSLFVLWPPELDTPTACTVLPKVELFGPKLPEARPASPSQARNALG